MRKSVTCLFPPPHDQISFAKTSIRQTKAEPENVDDQTNPEIGFLPINRVRFGGKIGAAGLTGAVRQKIPSGSRPTFLIRLPSVRRSLEALLPSGARFSFTPESYAAIRKRVGGQGSSYPVRPAILYRHAREFVLGVPAIILFR